MAIRDNAGKNLYSEQHRGNFSFDEETQINVVEPVLYNPNGSVERQITGNLVLRLDDTSTTNVVYIGKAAIGTATSADTWQIRKLDTTDGLVMTYGGGSAEFNQVWDDRTSLSYS
jgi:hypothetical protein